MRGLLAMLGALALLAPLALAAPLPPLPPVPALPALPAEPQVVLAGPGAWASTYATPVVLYRGGALAFTNLDLKDHDVVALEASGPDAKPWCATAPQTYSGGCPLFWSELVGTGVTTAVLGLEDAEPGTYRFYCTLHRSMQGDLVVLPS